MALSAVAFDLDYTLAVPARDRQTLLNEATEAVGAPPLSREAYLAAHGDNLTTETRTPIFESLLADAETEVTPADLAAAYRERVTESLVPVAGVERLVANLRSRYRVGLLTNGPAVAQRDKLDALGWTDAFDATLVTGDLDAGKPDSEAFAALLAALGTAPEETVFVGDDVEADIRGAAEVGLLPIQVCFPGGPAPDPTAIAHVERAELAERLPALLAELPHARA